MRQFKTRRVRGNGRKMRKGKMIKRRKGTVRHPV